jgi:hypothetical protein
MAFNFMINRTSIYSVVYALGLLITFTSNPAVAQKRQTVEVPRQIVQRLMKDEDIKGFLEYRQEYRNSGLAKYLTAELIDLNRDGTSELIVRGINEICGATNCYTWIYRKVGNSYQMLLYAGFIQQIELKRTFTRGYRDIIASMHGSAWDSDLTLYKFDGKQYRQVGCYTSTYLFKDKSGGYRESKRPRINRVKCKPEQ